MDMEFNLIITRERKKHTVSKLFTSGNFRFTEHLTIIKSSHAHHKWSQFIFIAKY